MTPRTHIRIFLRQISLFTILVLITGMYAQLFASYPSVGPSATFNDGDQVVITAGNGKYLQVDPNSTDPQLLATVTIPYINNDSQISALLLDPRSVFTLMKSTGNIFAISTKALTAAQPYRTLSTDPSSMISHFGSSNLGTWEFHAIDQNGASPAERTFWITPQSLPSNQLVINNSAVVIPGTNAGNSAYFTIINITQTSAIGALDGKNAAIAGAAAAPSIAATDASAYSSSAYGASPEANHAIYRTIYNSAALAAYNTQKGTNNASTNNASTNFTAASLSGLYPNWNNAWTLPTKGSGVISFSVFGGNDITFLISPTQNNGVTADPANRTAAYEIVIGGWNNGISAIRKNPQGGGGTLAGGYPTVGNSNWNTAKIPANSATNPANFTVSVVQNGTSSVTITVTGAVDANNNPVTLTYTDTTPILNNQYFSFSSWNSSITYSNIAVATYYTAAQGTIDGTAAGKAATTTIPTSNTGNAAYDNAYNAAAVSASPSTIVVQSYTLPGNKAFAYWPGSWKLPVINQGTINFTGSTTDTYVCLTATQGDTNNMYKFILGGWGNGSNGGGSLLSKIVAGTGTTLAFWNGQPGNTFQALVPNPGSATNYTLSFYQNANGSVTLTLTGLVASDGKTPVTLSYTDTTPLGNIQYFSFSSYASNSTISNIGTTGYYYTPTNGTSDGTTAGNNALTASVVPAPMVSGYSPDYDTAYNAAEQLVFTNAGTNDGTKQADSDFKAGMLQQYINPADASSPSYPDTTTTTNNNAAALTANNAHSSAYAQAFISSYDTEYNSNVTNGLLAQNQAGTSAGITAGANAAQLAQSTTGNALAQALANAYNNAFNNVVTLLNNAYNAGSTAGTSATTGVITPTTIPAPPTGSPTSSTYVTAYNSAYTNGYTAGYYNAARAIYDVKLAITSSTTTLPVAPTSLPLAYQTAYNTAASNAFSALKASTAPISPAPAVTPPTTATTPTITTPTTTTPATTTTSSTTTGTTIIPTATTATTTTPVTPAPAVTPPPTTAITPTIITPTTTTPAITPTIPTATPSAPAVTPPATTPTVTSTTISTAIPTTPATITTPAPVVTLPTTPTTTPATITPSTTPETTPTVTTPAPVTTPATPPTTPFTNLQLAASSLASAIAEISSPTVMQATFIARINGYLAPIASLNQATLQATAMTALKNNFSMLTAALTPANLSSLATPINNLITAIGNVIESLDTTTGSSTGQTITTTGTPSTAGSTTPTTTPTTEATGIPTANPLLTNVQLAASSVASVIAGISSPTAMQTALITRINGYLAPIASLNQATLQATAMTALKNNFSMLTAALTPANLSSLATPINNLVTAIGNVIESLGTATGSSTGKTITTTGTPSTPGSTEPTTTTTTTTTPTTTTPATTNTTAISQLLTTLQTAITPIKTAITGIKSPTAAQKTLINSITSDLAAIATLKSTALNKTAVTALATKFTNYKATATTQKQTALATALGTIASDMTKLAGSL